MQLVIGDKNTSSWSMRPWLALKRIGVPFEEVWVRMRREDTAANLLTHSGSGKAPVLKDGELTVWDTLAICEYLADKFPDAALWPADLAKRALARSASAEMHSGFASLRGECPMDLVAEKQMELSELTHQDVRRIVNLWNDLRGRFGGDGPYLVGEWSIADAFFTPVATRFRTYGVILSEYGDTGPAGTYASTLLAEPHFQEWEEGARGQVAQVSAD
jgi:glutathione S-transferase